MKGSVKFAVAASALIITFALLISVGLGIYPSRRGWRNRSAGWGTPKTPAGAAAQSWMEDSQTLKTSNGQLTISDRVDETRLGAPIYPGASKQGMGTAVYSDAGTGSEELAGARFTTPDDFDKVLAFYKRQVDGKALVDVTDDEMQRRAVLSRSSSDGQDTLGISIVRAKESAQTEITIHRGIEHAGPAAARAK